MKNELIRIDGEITISKASEVVEKIIIASRDENVKNIVLLISSGGGTISTLPLFEEVLAMTKKNVIAIGTMLVASCAASIFMMAKTRILFPKTEFVLHKARYVRKANIVEAEEYRTKSTNLLWSYVISNSTLDENVLNEKCECGDWILNNDEISKYSITTQSYSQETVRQFFEM